MVCIRSPDDNIVWLILLFSMHIVGTGDRQMKIETVESGRGVSSQTFGLFCAAIVSGQLIFGSGLFICIG